MFPERVESSESKRNIINNRELALFMNDKSHQVECLQSELRELKYILMGIDRKLDELSELKEGLAEVVRNVESVRKRVCDIDIKLEDIDERFVRVEESVRRQQGVENKCTSVVEDPVDMREAGDTIFLYLAEREK